MKFVIVTGLSGSGKSETMKALEDMGFYCVAVSYTHLTLPTKLEV